MPLGPQVKTVISIGIPIKAAGADRRFGGGFGVGGEGEACSGCVCVCVCVHVWLAVRACVCEFKMHTSIRKSMQDAFERS